MSQVVEINETIESNAAAFVDRRNHDGSAAPARERRQFTNSHDGLSPDARELAVAVDQYKSLHGRRFVTYEEMLSVVRALGYKK